MPSKRLPKNITVGSAPVPDAQFDTFAPGEDARGETRSGQILWIRGLTRLQTQVRDARSRWWHSIAPRRVFTLSVCSGEPVSRCTYGPVSMGATASVRVRAAFGAHRCHPLGDRQAVRSRAHSHSVMLNLSRVQLRRPVWTFWMRVRVTCASFISHAPADPLS